MNILPKKNWHVRTKKNIERVRRDEAKAAEEAKELDRRMRLAEQEARTTVLREKAKQKMIQSGVDPFSVEGNALPVSDVGIVGTSGHVNFFQQLENGEGGDVRTNKEHEEEKKAEQEEYEKKVGYLTYLGQDTEELTGEQVWWKKLPTNRKDNTEESLHKAAVGQKQKDFLDPLGDLKKHLQCDGERLTYQKFQGKREATETKSISLFPKIKRKKRKRSSSSSSRGRSRSRSKDRRKKSRKHSSKKRRSHLKKKRKRKDSESSNSTDSEVEAKKKAKTNLEKLRRERLERERVEREKANRLLYGEPVQEKSSQEELKSKAQKYSSQFNPEIARQNKLDPSKKYWLE